MDPQRFIGVILKIVKLLLGKKLRKRILVHSGGDAQVMERLKMYGLTPDRVPTCLEVMWC
jgi:hypothetical protein